MRKVLYDLLQKIFVVAMFITFFLGLILVVVQVVAMLMLNGELSLKVYDILLTPMCLSASTVAVCGALRPYVKGGKVRFDNDR